MEPREAVETKFGDLFFSEHLIPACRAIPIPLLEHEIKINGQAF